MLHLDLGNVSEDFFDGTVVLYGAGYSSNIIANMLLSKGVTIDVIVDDDPMKWNTKWNDINIISAREFRDYICSHVGSIHCILAMIYGKTIEKRWGIYPNVLIYEMYDEYCRKEFGGYYWEIITNDKLEILESFTQNMECRWADVFSNNTLIGICRFLRTGDFSHIHAICSEEEQYFITPVINYFKEIPLNIIDGGACKGELYRAMSSLQLKIGVWHCFEADPSNFHMLKHNIDKMGVADSSDVICKGLWDREETIYFEQNGTGSKIVEYQTDCMIDTVRIDDLFQNAKINFIKMDIEGAEFRALLGAMKTIKRCRPVLAISIYHSMEDFYRIPLMLMKELANYKYYVRQHAMILSETVLYAIPENKE